MSCGDSVMGLKGTGKFFGEKRGGVTAGEEGLSEVSGVGHQDDCTYAALDGQREMG